jgi:glycosyltransferase involved in cell wall biosynthesis
MTTDAVGGVWQYATDLSAALVAIGHEVVLALLGPSLSPDQRRRAQSIPGVRLVETGLPLDWLCSGPEPVTRAARAVAALAQQEDADLIHCNMPTLAGAAEFSVPAVAVTHGCVATWWQAAKNEPLAPAYRWHRDMMRQGLAAAAAVVAPSASYAMSVKRTYRLPVMPSVVHNGREAAVRKREGDPARAAVTVGRLWDPVKNAALLDGVAGELEVPFLAAGAQCGPHGETIALRNLLPLGQLDGRKLAALLAAQPVFVSAATFEPFGLAVLEAAAAGCALVLSDIPTFRELWDGAAVFADANDPAAFGAAIAAILADPAEREALGTSAASRAERFTPSATALAMSGIYRQLLGLGEAAA